MHGRAARKLNNRKVRRTAAHEDKVVIAAKVTQRYVFVTVGVEQRGAYNGQQRLQH